MRSPLLRALAEGAAGDTAAGAGAAGGFSAGAGAGSGVVGSLASAPFDALAIPSTAEASSPSSRITAIGVLIGIASVPSAINILPTTPSSMASISIVALSVSTSAMISPDSTLSPSALSHLANVPSVIVGDKAGISTCMGMKFSP